MITFEQLNEEKNYIYTYSNIYFMIFFVCIKPLSGNIFNAIVISHWEIGRC